MGATLNPYLNFNGNTREAMEFYQGILGGKLDIQTFADFQAPVSEAYKDKVMHAHLETDGIVLMASDPMEGSSLVIGDNFNLSLIGGPDDHDRLSSVFADLSEGGKVTMPLGEVQWGATFGMVTDKFGVGWLINIEKPAE